MTWRRLVLFCLIGAALWALIIMAVFFREQVDWEEAARWAVLIVVAVFTVGTIWLKVEKDQEYLDELEAQREAEGLELADEEPPHAA